MTLPSTSIGIEGDGEGGPVLLQEDRQQPRVRSALQICGQTLRSGTDDFVYSSVVESIFRYFIALTYIIFMVFDLTQFELNPGVVNCVKNVEDNFLVPLWVILTVSAVIQVLELVVAVFLCCQSRRGVIWDPRGPEIRKWVASLVVISMILLVFEACILILLTFAISVIEISGNCTSTDKNFLIVLTVFLVFHWVYLSVEVLVSCLIVDPFRLCQTMIQKCPATCLTSRCLRRHSHGQDFVDRHPIINCLHGFCLEDTQLVHFNRIADTLTDLMDDPTLVTSDVLASLLLIYLRGARVSQPTYGLPSQSSNISDWMNPEAMYHYMTYARAIYGCHLCLISPSAFWSNICGILSRGVGYRLEASCCNTELGNRTRGVGCFMLDLTTVLSFLPWLERQDILCFDYMNPVVATPFMMTADHRRHKIVITVRGTGSFTDVLTDLMAAPCPIREAGSGKDSQNIPELESLSPEFEAHGGVAAAAVNIYHKLMRSPNRPLLNALNEYPGYGVVVTGHSLGAGVASVLGFLLRTVLTGGEDLVQVFAFSPPGGLLNQRAREVSRSFICSVVNGQEIVPRISLYSLQRLRRKIKDALRACELPKYKILAMGASFCCNYCYLNLARRPFAVVAASTTSWGENGLRESAIRVVGDIQDDEETSESGASDADSFDPMDYRLQQTLNSWPVMLLPGRIFHMITTTNVDDDERRQMMRRDVDAEEYLEIKVVPMMLVHHHPDSLLQALEYHLNNIEDVEAAT